ncbi:hypothetical protein [Neobacillus kokaensis]|uniref:Plasmid segregation centromere-binding protein ParR n=1 Tax=Neobacillus kokaensis TaxID=2759023 RepID=A0ABQ3N225_9BACI|nr:hypothetical protein [Neobacillus kokaensis]GHH98038.1 hypothetical protein AM1BK_15810 [Neobacillus kokaensis]
MKKSATTEIKRGQAISFRLPSDTPEHLLKEMQRLKETERRNFSSKIADFVLQGVSNSYSRDKESITIPLPKSLTKMQRNWLKHEHSEALLGSILYQLIADPIRATSLLASLNSKSLDLEEALYLQEEMLARDTTPPDDNHFLEEAAAAVEQNDLEDDLDALDWTQIKNEEPQVAEPENDDEDDGDLLGGFLASMNK